MLTPLLGSYMAKVFSGEKHILSAIRPLERIIYRVCFIDEHDEMTWQRYVFSVMILSIFGLAAVFSLQLIQYYLPLNPQKLENVSWQLAINTAISFVTNTNWQAYAGESTLSYLTQTLGLCVQNFLSAATGIAVLLALIRGLMCEEKTFIGNFWVDATRAIIYVLLPLSIIFALVLASQGVLQNFGAYVSTQTLEGERATLPMGPVASQEAIKQLGTNGGGFFGGNSSHPFENPNAVTNFIEMLAMLLIPSALVYMFGVLTRARKHAMVIYCVMFAILAFFLSLSLYMEHQPNVALGLSENWEGKDVRFDISTSVLWSTITTASSSGSVNAMHDSLMPLAGGNALVLMLLGEIAFGGVGSGLYGMLLFVMFAVFLSGLMVGRTPEYFGKKIEADEIKLVLIALLSPSAVVLLGSALSVIIPETLKSIGNPGPHGLSEILYAWGSAANNNGSAFGGLNANTDFFNIGLSASMLIGRFAVIVPVLMISGKLAAKRTLPITTGTFRTYGFTFFLLLVAVIFLVGSLTFMPALVLGPVAEYFLMNKGIIF